MAHRYDSWGRTRRPKNVNGTASTSHAVSETEYFTENQRFLHVQCGSSANATKIELYYHASGVWSELVELADADGGPIGGTIAVAASTVRIFEIAGADKVRVTHAGDSSNAANKCFLSLSTF